MKGSTVRHLRMIVFVAATIIALAIGGLTHGWSSVPAIIPIPIVLAVALFAWSRRDSDIGAVISHRLDERLVDERLRVQALVGRVLSLAVAVAFIVATAAGAILWPWAILLGLGTVSFGAGWLLYGDHGRPGGSDKPA